MNIAILSNNIRFLRKKHGYSQDKLAELLGYKSFTTIQKWESGIAEPPLKTLSKLADIFCVDIDDLAKVDLESGICINSSKPLTDIERSLLSCFLELNDEGQEKLFEYARLLSSSGQYKKHSESEVVEA